MHHNLVCLALGCYYWVEFLQEDDFYVYVNVSYYEQAWTKKIFFNPFSQ